MALLEFINLQDILGNTPGTFKAQAVVMEMTKSCPPRTDGLQAVYRQGGELAVLGSDPGGRHRLHHRVG